MVEFAYFYPPKLQRLYQLGSFKVDMEESHGPMTADALWKKFASNLTVTHGEQLSKTYVTLAMRIWDNVLKSQSIREILHWSDECFGGKKSPMNSLYKLEGLMQASKGNPEDMRAILMLLMDTALNGVIRPSEMSLQCLTGRNTSSGKGWLGWKIEDV